jgi:GH24 family phage-related lysozyme (muramidase)
MPVRYDIAAQVPQIADMGIDPLNMMAQLRQQRMSEAQLARMAQSMDVQDMQARIAAQRELRQAEAAERQAQLFGKQSEDIDQKLQTEKINVYKNMFQNFVNDQKSLDSFVAMMEKDFPQGVAAFKGKPYSDDWKQSLIKPEGDYMEAGGEVYRKTARGLVPAPIIQPGAPPAPAAEAVPGPRQDITTELIKQREGFIEKPKYDVNAYRGGYGSDTVTLSDGTVQKVTPGTRISREDAERDLQRRIQTEFVPKAAAKVGEENWARLPENTRAALTSIAYNYGTIPSRLVPAVQSGNPETIARAIEGLAGDNKGVNAGRRMQEANIARGTAMPGSRAVPAFAAGGLPTFMGGPDIQPPINMLAGAPPVANAMVAPPAPVAPVAAPAPMQPVTVGTRKQIKGQSNIDMTLDKMLGSYEKLRASGDIVSSETAASNPLGTLGQYLKGTTLGQATEKARGTKAQDVRNRIAALRGQLLQDIKESTGQSSKELDSNFELKLALERLADPTMSIESVRAIVADLSARYGSGKVKLPEETAAPVPTPQAPAAGRTITRRGTYNGRPVVEYSDGTVDYAN